MKFLVVAGVLFGLNGSAFASPPENRIVGELPIGMTAVADARLRIEAEFDAPVQAVLQAHLDDAAAENEVVTAMGRAFGFGVDAVYCVHTMGMVKGPTTSRCATAAGEAVELNAAWNDFVARRYAAHGSMTQPMVEAIDAGAAGDWHDATVWLRQPAPEPREFLPRDAETFEMLEERRVTRQAEIADACRVLEGCRVVEQAKIQGPFIYVSATRAGLEELAFYPIVGAVEPTIDIDMEPAQGNLYLPAGNFDWIQAQAPAWDGLGTKVAIVEGPRIEAAALPAFAGIHDPATDLYCNASLAGSHAGTVGSVVAADSSFGLDATRVLDGAAPATNLLVANVGQGGQMPSRNCTSSAADPDCDPNCGFNASATGAINWARGKQTHVINFSNQGTDPTIPYRELDRYFDWVANNNPWPVMVPITGQIPAPVHVSTAGCFNCLVVGGSDDHNTIQRTDDTKWLNTDYQNRPSGLEVPHVVAPAILLRVLEKNFWRIGHGTSLAAPQVSGLAASLIGRHLDLASYPEAVRALIMATATNDVDGVNLDLSDGIDDWDGAGAINARLAAEVLSSGVKNVWNSDEELGLNFGLMSSADFSSNNYYNKILIFTAPQAWRRFQATLTWNVISSCTDTANNCPGMSEPEAIGNYAIEVHEGLGNIVAQSTTTSISHNYVHVRIDSLVPGKTYVLFIKRIWENPNPPGLQYFGLAWHTFNPFFE